ncbi:MAG: hypothetical protein O3A63_02445 [Proteobacteria bacterium]|nr:hypothetical protein [Pseudomonadota bacterium]
MKCRFLGVFILVAVATAAVSAQEIRPGVFRTPDDRFQNLPGFALEPHYRDIAGYRDPVTGGQDEKFRLEVPGAQGQEHITVDFIAPNPAQDR